MRLLQQLHVVVFFKMELCLPTAAVPLVVRSEKFGTFSLYKQLSDKLSDPLCLQYTGLGELLIDEMIDEVGRALKECAAAKARSKGIAVQEGRHWKDG